MKSKGANEIQNTQNKKNLTDNHSLFSAGFSDDFNKLCIPFENSLSEDQIDVFHKILDCVSDTAAAEMRAAYKVGFKDGAILMKEVQE